MSTSLLSIEKLHVSFNVYGKRVQAVRGNNLSINKGELHSLVGESGSGKTVTSTAVLGLLPVPPAEIEEGKIHFAGRDLLTLSPAEMRQVRGKEIGMVFQEPSRYLNPAFKIGEQIREMLLLHQGMTRQDADDKVVQTLEHVGLKDSARVASSYPHELSGGMKQRAMIGMAICCEPSLLIADEPTTALDVTIQRQILSLILQIRNENSMGILFVSHDLSVVEDISDRVSVIYAGKIVESAPREQFFSGPLHPYSKLLLLSIPDRRRRGTRLKAITGRVPNAEDLPAGCAFHPRCPLAKEICSASDPQLKNYKPDHKAACHFAGESWMD